MRCFDQRGSTAWRLRASARTVTFLMCESQGSQEEYDRVITNCMVIVTAQLSSLLATKCVELLPRGRGGNSITRSTCPHGSMKAAHLRGVVEGLLFPLLRHAPLRMHLLVLYHLLRRWQVESPPQRHPRPTVPVDVRSSSSFIRNDTGIDPAPIARYKLHT